MLSPFYFSSGAGANSTSQPFYTQNGTMQLTPLNFDSTQPQETEGSGFSLTDLPTSGISGGSGITSGINGFGADAFGCSPGQIGGGHPAPG